VAPPVQMPSHQVVRTTWNFVSGSDQCVAVAAAGATSLRIAVSRAAPIRLTLSLAMQLWWSPASHAAVPLRFNGPAGRWQVTAQPSGNRQIIVTLGSDESALSRVLVLLSGGVLDVIEAERIVVSLVVGPSDAQGQLWFDCARSKMI
jgi:hypothetical protein